MKAPIVPADEQFRVMALQSLDILDTDAETRFDDLVATGQALFGVETCLVSLVDTDRQWFKAKAGLDADQTGRDISFCGHAILEDQVFVIPNATEDDRFHDNPLVTGPPDIRFYAGAQLRLPSGYTIGTVCLLEPAPRYDFDLPQRLQLKRLADLAVEVIAARALGAELNRERTITERQKMLLEASGGPFALISAAGEIEDCTMMFANALGTDAEPGMSLDAALKDAGHAEGFDPAAAAADGATINLADGTALRVDPDSTGFVVYPA